MFDSKKVLTVNASFDQVMRALEDALCSIGAIVLENDRTNGQIKAKTGLSIRLWGEDILITVSRSETGCSVDVDSTCSSQLVDWGKNRANVSNLARALSLITNSEVVIGEVKKR